MKKFISFLLILSIVLAAVVSCAEKDDAKNNESTAPPSGDNLTATEEIDSGLKPDIPSNTDMGGKTFMMLVAGWGSELESITDVTPESVTAETLNDAAYKRKTQLENDLKCTINAISYGSSDAVTNLQKAVMANDPTYDFALIKGANFSSLLMGNSYLHELTELPYLDVDKPWWNRNVYDALAINGTHYGVSGDINSRHMTAIWTACFNKTLIKNYSLESPFELVKSGDWTFDKVMEMGKVVGQDLDSNDKMDINDLWGINYTGDTIMGIFNSANVSIAELDSDGIPVITVDSEKNVTRIMNIIDKLFDNTYSIDTLFKMGNVGDVSDTQIFADGKCLILFTAMHQVNPLREMDIDFGIVPYPKYTKEEDYRPACSGAFLPILCVPKTNTDLENTGIFLEAFAYEGSRTVVPAFYEVILKTKMSRDEESAEMIEYIFTNLKFNTGEIFNFGNICGLFGYNLATTRKVNIVSMLERNKPALEKDINKILTQISQ